MLEGANSKLAAVATNVLGVSGRERLNPEVLADFARLSLRQKLPQVRQAVEGRVQPHQRRLLAQILFPSAKHLASWAGVCPGTKQSAGKRLGGKPTKSNTWLRGILGELAWTSPHTRGTDFGAQFRRLARRRGTKRAAVAVVHSLVVVIYQVLRDQRPDTELGADSFDKLDAAQSERPPVRRLEQLGYAVTLTPLPAA